MQKEVVKKTAGFKVLAVILVILLAAVTFTSCIRITGFSGSGNLATQERNISGIKSVSVSAGMNLYIEQSGSESLRIEADDNVIPKILTEVKDGNLVIKYKPWLFGFGGINVKSPVNIYLTVADIDAISASSGAYLESSTINTDSLKITLSSGSSGKVEIEVSGLIVDLSSGSNLEIEGTAEQQEADLSSGVKYDAYDLKSLQATLDVSSGAVADINVSERLDVDISSGATVRYIGTPKIVSDISSGGNLKNVSE
jgi:hypothetical protein